VTALSSCNACERISSGVADTGLARYKIRDKKKKGLSPKSTCILLQDTGGKSRDYSDKNNL
jgi:hypothetical protein